MKAESDGFISASTLAQKHICERVNGSYPVNKAMELLETASAIGFGSMEETHTPTSNRKIRKLRKRPYAELPPEAKRVLTSFSITEDVYDHTREQ